MKNKIIKKSSGTAKYVAIGASIAGIAAAYFFLGPKGKINQRKTKAWAIKMKADVVEKLEEVRDMSEPVYHQIIDTIAKEYEEKKKVGREEIQSLAMDLKKHWKTISKEIGIGK